jgi:hypothetical protein
MPPVEQHPSYHPGRARSLRPIHTMLLRHQNSEAMVDERSCPLVHVLSSRMRKYKLVVSQGLQSYAVC